MQEHFEFNPAYTLMTAALAPGEQIKAEPGAMVAYQGVTIETGSNGGMLKGFLKKAFTGESFFLNTFTAGPSGGWVSLAPGAPGDITAYDVSPGRELYITKGCYMASTPSVQTDTKMGGLKNMLGGEGLFMIRAHTEGETGRVYFNSFGGIKPIPVQPGQSVIVDTGHLVAYESSLTFTTQKAGNLKSALLGGEGLVMSFTGEGTLWIQTRNFPSLVERMVPFLPRSGN